MDNNNKIKKEKKKNCIYTIKCVLFGGEVKGKEWNWQISYEGNSGKLSYTTERTYLAIRGIIFLLYAFLYPNA